MAEGHLSRGGQRRHPMELRQGVIAAVSPCCNACTLIRLRDATLQFLVGRDGMPVKRYDPKVAPNDMASDIEALLGDDTSGSEEKK